MSSHHSAGPVACGLVTTLLVAAGAGLAAETTKGGGPEPQATGPAPRLTREELLRSWDLDGDGSLSKSEADIARARMRRTRLELHLNAGIDPLTGLPRGDGTETSGEQAAEEPLFQLPPETPPREPRRAKAESPPDLRALEPQSQPAAVPSLPRPLPPATPGGPAPRPLSARASWLPPQRHAPTATGGVRAGAPAAVPGYGAGSQRDLNAGRPAVRIPASGDGSPRPSGGLLPSVRPPGRTGSLVLPPASGRAIGPAPPRLPQQPAARALPRITADEIGAERP